MSTLETRRTAHVTAVLPGATVAVHEGPVTAARLRARGLIGLATAAWARLVAERRRRRRYRSSLRELQVLSDRTLGDIGLDRSQLHSVANKASRFVA